MAVSFAWFWRLKVQSKSAGKYVSCLSCRGLPPLLPVRLPQCARRTSEPAGGSLLIERHSSQQTLWSLSAWVPLSRSSCTPDLGLGLQHNRNLEGIQTFNPKQCNVIKTEKKENVFPLLSRSHYNIQAFTSGYQSIWRFPHTLQPVSLTLYTGWSWADVGCLQGRPESGEADSQVLGVTLLWLRCLHLPQVQVTF